jgi:signal transduction histidine kinase
VLGWAKEDVPVVTVDANTPELLGARSGANPPAPNIAGVRALWKRLIFMPPLRVSSAPIDFSAQLIIYFAVVLGLSITAVAVVPGPAFSAVPAAVLSIAAFASAYFSVSAVAEIDAAWSTVTFTYLVAVLTIGPRGLACVVILYALGHGARYKVGWFRMVFNAATHVIEGTVALLVFEGLRTNLIAAGMAAGLTDLAVNSILLMGAISIASHKLNLRFWVKATLGISAYEAVYGLGAAAAFQLYPHQGIATYVELLGTPLALQGFLVLLARRVHWFNEQNKQHQEARVRLLQQAIDASNTERERIAASIHDGVVQDLVGLAFSLGAFADIDPNSLTEEDLKAIASLMRDGAETARIATRDLRTLIIEIASPKLKHEGLRAALNDLLHNVSGNVETNLDMPEELDSIGEGQQALLYRVAQEAMRNSVKYSEASHLTVGISKEKQDIVLLVVDNGKGFTVVDRAKRQEEGHVGLTLLERTVKDGGGAFEIWSEPGQGTRITMRVPASAPGKAEDQPA